jgi:hypothetical protein
MVIVQIEKVPQAALHAAWKAQNEDEAEDLYGLTVTPPGRSAPFRGLTKVQIFILDKQSQYRTRQTIAHELLHLYTFLCGCSTDEGLSEKLEDILVHGLKERKV